MQLTPQQWAAMLRGMADMVEAEAMRVNSVRVDIKHDLRTYTDPTGSMHTFDVGNSMATVVVEARAPFVIARQFQDPAALPESPKRLTTPTHWMPLPEPPK